MFSKEIYLVISYYVDDAQTFNALKQINKEARAACEYRQPQKDFLFQQLYVTSQVDDYDAGGFRKITEQYPTEYYQFHHEAKHGARILLAGSVFGDGKLSTFKKSRLEIMQRLGTSPM